MRKKNKSLSEIIAEEEKELKNYDKKRKDKYTQG